MQGSGNLLAIIMVTFFSNPTKDWLLNPGLHPEVFLSTPNMQDVPVQREGTRLS